ncbi:MAG TPA: kelch repeat-containing protein [Candidatus Rifleibacterium sp.]|nr:kelch repeat-containing protein [Candidatus Rifleibacterium sp.]
MDAITSRDTWTGYKKYPANFYLAAADTVSGGNNTDKRDSNRRHFGYFRPAYDAMQVAVANQDHSRLFVNQFVAGSRNDTGAEGTFVYKVSQASYTTSLFQIDYNTNAGNVKQGIFTHTDPTQSVGAISSSGSGDSKYMTMGSSWTAIASNSTIPFRFQPTFLTIYELTNCNNDSASAMVWSRDIADPILYFLDTIQDDVWVIKPGKPATRIDYGATSINFTDNQLVISNDGQSLIAAREDNNTVMFFNISEPTSFNFPGGTIAESSLPSNFGKIDFIATMSAKPTVLAASPYNVFKSSTTKGTYQWVATLSLAVSGNSNAALASGGIYIMGGSPELNSAPTDKIFFFDPTKVYTSNIPPLATTLSKAIKRHSTVAYDNEIYVFNGMDSGGNNLAWVQKYNPETKTVTSSFDPPAVTTTEYIVNQKMSADDKANGASTTARLTSTGTMADGDSQRYKAFDHLTATANNYWSTTTNGNWIKYYAGANPVYVNKLYLDNTVSPNSNGVNSFLLEGSNDDSDPWTTLVSSSQPINTLDHPVSLTNPGMYKFFRFTVNTNHGGTYRTIKEIKLVNTDVRRISPLGAGTVDAANKKATFGTKVVSWSAHGGSDYGSKVFDGNVNDTDKWDTNTASGFPHWIALDLGTPDNIDIVRIHCENANDGIKNFLFQYSTDGVSWSTLNINGAATNTNPDNTAWNTYHVTNPNSYRHYRLVCNDSWTSEIKAWEIEFFSSMPATAASNKPVMTKTMTDMRGETQTTDGAACTTPYGIVVGGGATSTVLVYWPHGKDNYNGPNDQSIGICRSLPKFPLENGAAGTDDRAYHSLVWHKGKLYRVGGRRGSTLLNSVDVFDFNTNSWTNIMLNNMTQFPANGSMLQRDNAAACSFGDEIFMFGGSIGASVGATPLNDAVAWNPETKTVRSLGTMAIAKNFAKTAVPCGSAIYLIGGATNHSTGGDANIWKFTP